jgi:hypothetical protein
MENTAKAALEVLKAETIEISTREVARRLDVTPATALRALRSLPVLRISDEDPTSIEEPFETTLAEFVEANAEEDAPGVARRAAGLRVGESFLVGGGAAPVVRIERVR